jgi:uncharacterized protein (TIGR03083 family)
MALPRQIVSDGLLVELGRFADLVRGLTDEEWARPSRCTGWSVGDVASHLVGTVTDITQGRFDGMGTPEVTQREVDERRGQAPKQVADECDESRATTATLLAAFDDATWEGPAPGGYNGTLGDGVEAIRYDAYLHADDIRAAIGHAPELGPGLDAAVSHVLHHLVDLNWGGDVPADRPAQHEFVLAATGRRPVGDDGPPNIYAA